MRGKLFVVDARRLLPLLFLLVLLVSLSVYDTFRASPTAGPGEAARATEVKLTTVDKGETQERPTFRLAFDREGWAEIAEEWGIVLPGYPFQPNHEVALFAMHGEIQSVQYQAAGDNELEVKVRVNPKRDRYHVLVLPVSDVSLAGGETVWTFLDKKNNVLEQFTAPDVAATATDEIIEK